MSSANRRWLLARYPSGVPAREDFALENGEARDPKPGEVRVRVIYLSMDPAPRMRMNPVSSMGPPLSLGSLVVGRGAGRVEASTVPEISNGDFVVGELGWQEQAVIPAQAVRKVDCADSSLSAHLGVLASSGLAAYLTLVDCGRAQAGETVVVSAAAGSVGLTACQLAHLHECRVVAVAHGPSQSRFLEERLALSAVVDDTAPEWVGDLERATPKGVDVFLDSVGGNLHDRVMDRINVRGRAVLYGYISAYNAVTGSEPPYGRMYRVIHQRAHVMGFLLPDHAARTPEVLGKLTEWLKQGRLKSFEALTEGFEQLPEAFAGIFGEAAPGKHLVRISPDPTLRYKN